LNALTSYYDYLLSVFTSNYSDINTYKVSILTKLGSLSKSYGPTNFTVSDDLSCTSSLSWSDVDFG